MIHDTFFKRLSVVVVASNSPKALEKTLASLRRQGEFPDTEVIAVSNFEGQDLSGLRERFPFARSMALQRDATVPELRARGISLSSGEIVAFVEDYGFVDDRWCAEIKKAHDSHFSVVGGAVENRCPNKLRNWAVYFFDYGKYMLPATAGFAATLSGLNVSYKRAVLGEIEETFRDGFHETFVHEELKKKGHQLWLVPSAIVFLSKDYRLGETFRSFFDLARSFAGTRVVHYKPLTRALFGLGTCLLPVVLPLRVVLRVIPKRRNLSRLFLCIPILTLLMIGWAAGEFCGYVFSKAANPRNSAKDLQRT